MYIAMMREGSPEATDHVHRIGTGRTRQSDTEKQKASERSEFIRQQTHQASPIKGGGRKDILILFWGNPDAPGDLFKFKGK